MKNKHGRIVSKKKHNMGKKSLKHLKNMGYVAKKGHFKLFRKSKTAKRNRRGKHKGGMPYGGPLAPESLMLL